jgi:hypothetical protein
VSSPPELELELELDEAVLLLFAPAAAGGGEAVFGSAAGAVPFNAAGGGGGTAFAGASDAFAGGGPALGSGAVPFAAVGGGGGTAFGSAAGTAVPFNAAGGGRGAFPASGAVPLSAAAAGGGGGGGRAVLFRFDAAGGALALELEFETMVVFETIVAVPFATLGIAVGPAPFERVTVLRMVCGGCVTVEVTFCPATSWVTVLVVPGCVRIMTITCTELEDEELDDELEELDEDDEPAPAWPLVLEFELPSPEEPAEDDEPVLPLDDEDEEPLEDEDDETDPESTPDETIVAPGAEG